MSHSALSVASSSALISGRSPSSFQSTPVLPLSRAASSPSRHSARIPSYQFAILSSDEVLRMLQTKVERAIQIKANDREWRLNEGVYSLYHDLLSDALSRGDLPLVKSLLKVKHSAKQALLWNDLGSPTSLAQLQQVAEQRIKALEERMQESRAELSALREQRIANKPRCIYPQRTSTEYDLFLQAIQLKNQLLDLRGITDGEFLDEEKASSEETTSDTALAQQQAEIEDSPIESEEELSNTIFRKFNHQIVSIESELREMRRLLIESDPTLFEEIEHHVKSSEESTDNVIIFCSDHKKVRAFLIALDEYLQGFYSLIAPEASEGGLKRLKRLFSPLQESADLSPFFNNPDYLSVLLQCERDGGARFFVKELMGNNFTRSCSTLLAAGVKTDASTFYKTIENESERGDFTTRQSEIEDNRGELLTKVLREGSINTLLEETMGKNHLNSRDIELMRLYLSWGGKIPLESLINNYHKPESWVREIISPSSPSSLYQPSLDFSRLVPLLRTALQDQINRSGNLDRGEPMSPLAEAIDSPRRDNGLCTLFRMLGGDVDLANTQIRERNLRAIMGMNCGRMYREGAVTLLSRHFDLFCLTQSRVCAENRMTLMRIQRVRNELNSIYLATKKGLERLQKREMTEQIKNGSAPPFCTGSTIHAVFVKITQRENFYQFYYGNRGEGSGNFPGIKIGKINKSQITEDLVDLLTKVSFDMETFSKKMNALHVEWTSLLRMKPQRGDYCAIAMGKMLLRLLLDEMLGSEEGKNLYKRITRFVREMAIQEVLSADPFNPTLSRAETKLRMKTENSCYIQ